MNLRLTNRTDGAKIFITDFSGAREIIERVTDPRDPQATVAKSVGTMITTGKGTFYEVEESIESVMAQVESGQRSSH